MPTDEFGGVAIEETPSRKTDEFGGVAVDEAPLTFERPEPLIPRTGPQSTIVGGPKLSMPEGAAASTKAVIMEEITTPAVPFPRFQINESDSRTMSVGKEAANIAMSIPEFFTTKMGAGAIVAGIAAPTLTAAAFTVDMLDSLGQQITSSYENWDKMTPNQKAVAATDVVGTTLMAGATGRAVAHGLESPAVKLARELNRAPQFDPLAEHRAVFGGITSADFLKAQDSYAPMTAKALFEQARLSAPEPIKASEEPQATITATEKGAENAILGQSESVLQSVRDSSRASGETVPTDARLPETSSGSQPLGEGQTQQQTERIENVHQTTEPESIPSSETGNEGAASQPTPTEAGPNTELHERAPEGVQSAPSGGEQVDPAKVASEIGLTFKLQDAPAVNYEGMPPEMVKQLKDQFTPQWEFTDRKTGSPTEGLTIYVPEGTPKQQIIERWNEKAKETQVVQTQVTPPPESGGTTAIKNAMVERDRAAMGLPAFEQPARQDYGSAWDDAMRQINENPGVQDNLIASLKANPRALQNATESALLHHRLVELKNEYNKSTRALAEASDQGRTADIPAINDMVQAWSDKVKELTDITKKVGTEWGRTGAARKMVAADDFSLLGLEMQKRADNGGRKLTAEERAQLAKVAADFKEKSDKLETHIQEHETHTATSGVDEQINALKKHSQEAQSLADKIVSALDKQANDARERLKGKLFNLPAALPDLVIIGAAEIAKAPITFAQWSTKMLGEFGEKIKPHLDEIWDKAHDLLDKRVSATIGVTREAKAAVKERVSRTPDTIDTIRAKIKDKVVENAGEDIGSLAQKLARIFVEQGVTDREELIDKVHGVLEPLIPDHTRTDTMNAISGYGKFKQLTKDEISKRLRDLKGQMQQLGKLEDMAKGEAPKKTGVERREPSDEERRLIAKVNEEKKKGGFTVTDPATQLKSALQSIKTRLTHEIADLEQQISSRERIVKDKRKIELDAEAKALKDKRDSLKKDFDALFGKKELTDEQRVKLAMAAVQKSISEYERRIKEGDLFPGKKPSKTPNTPALEAARARRDALREQLNELQDLATPKRTPEEIANQSYKTRVANQIAEMQEKLAAGDFTTKPKKELTLDAQANKLRADLQLIKNQWNEARAKDQLANRTKMAKIRDEALRAIASPRALLSSMDLSAVLRQGGFITLGHPVRASRSIGPMLKAFTSEHSALATEAEIRNRPNASLYERAGLFLAPLENRVKMHEEAFLPSWAEKVPGVRHSERAYVTFLNKLRADSFDSMVSSLSKSGTPLNEAELKAIANYINVATGRGNLGSHAAAAETLANVFFSPRLVTSRFQLLAGQPLYGGTLRTRKLIAGEYGRLLAGLSVVYGLGMLSGATVETDPRSSDFGKLKFGNTRVDPMMGLSQATVLLTRLGTGETKSVTGKVHAIRGKVPYGQSTSADVMANFLRSKLAPVPGTIVNVIQGKNVVGEPVTAGSIAKDLMVPISLQDIFKVMQDQGISKATAIEMLDLLGMSVQTFDASAKKK
jgi:hypothetical protein